MAEGWLAGFSFDFTLLCNPRMAASSVNTGVRPIFAIVSCIRSTPAQRELRSTSLFRTLLPSVGATVTQLELASWDVRLYLCADDDDLLFQNRTAEMQAAAPTGIRLLTFFFPRKLHRVPSREAAERAREHGAEYLHRTNDDIRYVRTARTPGLRCGCGEPTGSILVRGSSQPAGSPPRSVLCVGSIRPT